MTTLSELLVRCRANSAPLSVWEENFLGDVERRGFEPTPAQRGTLERIAARCKQVTPGDIAGMLGQRIAMLCRELLPKGYIASGQWRCGSTGGEPGSSLSVALHGRGLWIDHADCNQHGDALDLVAAVLFGGDLGRALAWAKSWLGIGDGVVEATRRPDPSSTSDVDEDAAAAKKRRRARQIWLEAQPGLIGTPAAVYLDGRGNLLSALPQQPRALRFHPGLWNAKSQRRWPALVCCIVSEKFGQISVHRIWLGPDGSGAWTKAPLPNPKQALGSYAGAYIPIWRGSSGKPLREAPTGDTVAIAEGVETALAIAQMAPEFRVLSAVSLGNMAKLALPRSIGTVILCPDHDARNEAARSANERAVNAAIRRFRDEGRRVRLSRPKTPDADWNDVLLDKAPE